MPFHLPFRRQLLAALALLCTTALALSLMYPAWVLDHLPGLSCSVEVCTDDPAHLEEAVNLYAASLKYLASNIAPLRSAPVALFCSRPGCYSFAFADGSAAKTIGKYVIVISPRGWKPYFIRHELIHRLQAQRLGILGMYRKPEWYIEGMAYTLSEDPREKLIDPFQSERTRFREWYRAGGRLDIWTTPTEP